MKLSLDDLKKRTLILTQTDPRIDIMFKSWIIEGYNADVIFFNVPKPLRLVRRFWMNIPLPFFQLWLGKWKKNIKNYDVVILHASEWTRNIPMWIHSVKPSMRIIYWYWNPVNKLSSPYKVKDNNVEYWTFDKDDANTYNMRLNIQYYSKTNVVENFSNIQQDVYFIGHDKGREKILNDLKYDLARENISYKFNIVKNNFIPYSEVCNQISLSNSILEVNQNGQVGLTLRAMESLFFEKKLITTNLYIKNMDFYSKNNIFIIGSQPISELRDFLNKPYDHSVDKYKKNYDVNAWFSNFFKDN